MDDEEKNLARFFEHKTTKSTESKTKSKTESKTDKKPKRKRSTEQRDEEKDQDREEIRRLCEYYCSSPAEFKIISRYKIERQREYVQEKQFTEAKELHASVFNGTHRFFSVVTDFISEGGGYVEQEMMNDLSLRTSIETEFIIHRTHNILTFASCFI